MSSEITHTNNWIWRHSVRVMKYSLGYLIRLLWEKNILKNGSVIFIIINSATPPTISSYFVLPSQYSQTFISIKNIIYMKNVFVFGLGYLWRTIEVNITARYFLAWKDVFAFFTFSIFLTAKFAGKLHLNIDL